MLNTTSFSKALPYVIINVAATADGKIDTVERRGAPISSERDRERVDELRASVDAVMVGGRTLHAEDPRLNVRSVTLQESRLARGEPRHPAKVAITSGFRLPPDSRFLTHGPARVILFLPGSLTPKPIDNVEVYPCDDVGDAMRQLARLGIRRLLVEGGGTLNYELFRLGMVDELQLYVAPLIFGGASAPTLADGTGLTREAAIRLGPPRVEVWDDGGVILRYMVNPS